MQNATVPTPRDAIPECFVALGTISPSPYAANGPAHRMPNAKVFIVTIEIPAMDITIATSAAMTLHVRVYLMICFSVSFFFPPNFRYRSFITIVDIHSRFESAEDIVAQMMAAEIRPTITPGACTLATAIMALLPSSARFGSVSFTARAARPISVGKKDMAAMSTAESSAACFAVFSSFAVSKRDTISGLREMYRSN